MLHCRKAADYRLPPSQVVTRFHGFGARFAWNARGGPVYGFRCPAARLRATEAFSMSWVRRHEEVFARALRVVGMVAFGASACSSMPDWVDPTNWIGEQRSDPTPQRRRGETPDLACIPDRPAPRLHSRTSSNRSRLRSPPIAPTHNTAPMRCAAAPKPPRHRRRRPPSVERSRRAAVSVDSLCARRAPAPDASCQQRPQRNRRAAAMRLRLTASTAQHAAPPQPRRRRSDCASATASRRQCRLLRRRVRRPAGAMAMVSPSDAALGFRPSRRRRSIRRSPSSCRRR